MDSDSEMDLDGGEPGAALDTALPSPEKRSVDKEKLSSDQQMLSRRNAAEMSLFPVCSRTMASSIRPRWKHA